MYLRSTIREAYWYSLKLVIRVSLMFLLCLIYQKLILGYFRYMLKFKIKNILFIFLTKWKISSFFHQREILWDLLIKYYSSFLFRGNRIRTIVREDHPSTFSQNPARRSLCTSFYRQAYEAYRHTDKNDIDLIEDDDIADRVGKYYIFYIYGFQSGHPHGAMLVAFLPYVSHYFSALLLSNLFTRIV